MFQVYLLGGFGCIQTKNHSTRFGTRSGSDSACSSEKSCAAWARIYILFDQKHHSKGMGKAKAEVKQVFEYLSRLRLLLAQILYGSGLRLMECLRLQVRIDIDIDYRQITDFPAFFCNPPAGRRLRHPDGPGVTRGPRMSRPP